MDETRGISIWTESDDETKAALPRLGKVALAEMEIVQVGTGVLAENLRVFLADFESVLEKQPENVGKYYIDEIELHLA